MIKLEGLDIVRGGNPVIRNSSLTVEKGQSVALQGPSGCGKSTLLKTLVGGCEWQSGHYLFNDKPVTPDSIQAVRLKTGYIGQESALMGTTVLEALQRPFSFRAFRNKTFPEQTLYRLMNRFLLSRNLLNHHPSALSGGQKQRFAIIRVLLLDPELIIADEPTSALDAESRDNVIEELLGTGRTVISTSHDQHWLDRCERIVLMDNGQVIGDKQHVVCH
ncbi:hypothetical protein GZ77_24895 [Endozoicomonas montiporae]|uniref:ABC transporter domain-containing protein n=2 Tax=Endozoicomonas montiporae TaxID=1027273 RepID=A0A081MYT8_9GAMM|nr:ABC transporter ATP-binding protein [Endozoicomonas montiporae]AMO54821.1 ABC transporter-like protein [Endozoicomonas montiporae CL-33]KEQ11361.1 hypothetical protein GZ77_24895 [Endozoicomonas montiporae]